METAVLLTRSPVRFDGLESLLAEQGLRLARLESARELAEWGGREDVCMLLIDCLIPRELSEPALQWLAQLREDSPVQIVLLCDGMRNQRGLESVDDVLDPSCGRHEVSLRLRLVHERWKRYRGVYAEKEFFRNAAREEEEVSSHLVEHTAGLKHAVHRAVTVRQELEQTNRELERIARLDGLSGLMNRASLFNAADVEMERCRRTGAPLCGVMVDIDHFKQINDAYGHACGDKVLRAVGLLLQRELRKYDQAGRYGGEEFLIVLPNSTLEKAATFAERFRANLESLCVDCAGTHIRLSASFGVAELRAEDDRDDWISRADRAMYLSKRRGRNHVSLETDLVEPDPAF